ncbi:hypothetical protein DM860_018082 [Cuscuta australis]|uniref:Uncharacterized protein n=1 Tax=Cuscuta australis TaxID=267555 RepID=A0A328D8Q5_9ASTE|nr:hypothetical protein DM860_018082 [Cuscuta australis]
MPSSLPPLNHCVIASSAAMHPIHLRYPFHLQPFSSIDYNHPCRYPHSIAAAMPPTSLRFIVASMPSLSTSISLPQSLISKVSKFSLNF